MAKINDIPQAKLKDDSHFYNPARQLRQAVIQYYVREHGVTPTDKQVENQIIKLLRYYNE